MQMLVYYCATNYKDIKVINGLEKGGLLDTIKNVDAKILPGLMDNQVFLDNQTGDFYNYCHESNQWKPAGNTGLHYSRAIPSLGSSINGEFMKKISVY